MHLPWSRIRRAPNQPPPGGGRGGPRGLVSARPRAVRWTWAWCLALLPMAAAGWPSARADTPTDGTEILNQARADYLDPRTGTEATLLSEYVRVNVQAAESFALTADQELSVEPGTTVVLPHRLTNTGNTAGLYRLNYANLAGDDYDLAGLKLYHDANGNGRVDPGEPEIANATTALARVGLNSPNLADLAGLSQGKVSLAAGESLALLLQGTVPAGEPVGRASRLALRATSEISGRAEANTDTVRTVLLPEFQFVKSASSLSPERKSTVTFTLQGRNVHLGQASGVPVGVDGVQQDLVVIRDMIPANTSFLRVDRSDTSRVLYHLVGSSLHSYQTAPPADLGRLDAVAFGFDALPAGTVFNVAFTVVVHDNAAGNSPNVAQVHLDDGIHTPPTIIDSNPVVLQIALKPPFIQFYRDETFTARALQTRLGAPLFVQADAAQCNLEPTSVETRLFILTSARTGDRETFVATETGPNTGIFRVGNRVPTLDAAGHPAQRLNGIVETVRDDVLTASLEGCGATITETTILVDPDGVVFDSKTDAPVPGARVTLVDASSGAPAVVFGPDGVTPAPSTVVTDAQGRYQFPTVAPGNYRLAVETPPGYETPSRVAFTDLPAGRVIHGSGSYGGVFRVDEFTGAVRVDVPADATAPPGTVLFVQKSASQKVAEISETLEYQVQVKNVTGRTLPGVVLTDELPAGFDYVPGTAALDKSRRADPLGKSGPRLEFALGSLANNTTVTLSYKVRLGPGALEGTGINRARATAPGVTSNLASEYVRVQGGVFSDKGVIFGKVFVDANRNRLQDPGELGIPGVRLFLEDGTFVITDSEGKYSFYGISARTHVVKLDPITLPAGAELEALSTQNAGDPGSQFVALRYGEMHKANFAEGSATPEILQQVRQRRARGEVVVAELDRGVKGRLTPDGVPIQPGDTKALPATGTVGSGGASDSRSGSSAPAQAPYGSISRSQLAPQAAPNFTSLLPPGTLDSGNSSLPASAGGGLPRVRLEQVVTNLDNSLGFVDMKDGDTLPMAQATVRIKGPMGASFVLKVDGKDVPRSHLGKSVTYAERQVELSEFIGVALRPGTNTLELWMQDGFGNPRGSRSITVTAPDRLGRIRIEPPREEAVADGVTPAKIAVFLQDAKGVPVTARTPLTLEASAGRWKTEDLDPREPGVQVFIEGGKAVFELLPPAEPGESRVVVSSGVLKSEFALAFLPDLRPLVANGLLEGTLNLNKLSRGSIVPTRSKDGFEEEIRSFAVSGNDEKLRAAARAAFFLKGKILGSYLLTAAYDSDKATQERLFRDIQPDEFYPVYGDSSVRGFDAQSTGRLYVRIDKRRCYLLYGDFNTQTSAESRGLGNYNRSLTGVREHYEKNRISANLWASQDTSRQVVEELPANGTSGPYYFSTGNGIVNSEQVEILTRDRHQPSEVIAQRRVSRFADYEFEPFTGRLLFKAPVPSLDANLNPISIRVTYEVDQGGPKFWVYGADAQVKVSERVEVGASGVRDENPQGAYQLYSANATVKVGTKTFLLGEVARSESDLIGSGNAGRVELRHKGETTDARVYIGKTDPTFTNNASLLMPGRVEGGMKVTQKLAPTVSLIGQGVISEDVSQHGSRKGVRVDVEKAFGNYRVELGFRHSEETQTPATPSMRGLTPNEVTSLRAKFTAPVPKVKNASLYGEYENDVVEPDKRMVAVGADYQTGSRSKLYARHEFISALGGPFELNTVQRHNRTVAGMETEYMKDGQLFNEYRMRDALTGREAEAATGLRNLWHVAEGVRLNTTFERVSPFTGSAQSTESTAGTAAIEVTPDADWKATARLELRTSTATDSLLNTLAYARKLSRDWTFLGRTILFLSESKGSAGAAHNQGRIQLGMAYRQTAKDIWNGLIKYEVKYEEGAVKPGADVRRKVHMLTGDANYQPTADWVFNLHYAGKLAIEDLGRASLTSHAHLAGTRALYQLTKRWDVGLNGNALFDGDLRSVQFAAGPEVGFTLRANARVGLGFNVIGFRDEDLAEDGFTNPGLFVSLRLKFDEGLLGRGNNSRQPAKP